MTANIEPFYLELGRKIHELRTRRGVTQEELGKRLNPSVTRASIANIESGKQRVYAHSLIELAQALHVTIPELLGQGDTHTPPAKYSSALTELDRFVDELSAKLPLKSDEIRELALRIGRAEYEPLSTDWSDGEDLP